MEGEGNQPIKPLAWSGHFDLWRNNAISLLRRRPEIIDAYREGGLLENQRWHRPANHQVVAAVMTIGICDLLQLDPAVDSVYLAATHDKDKRRQIEGMSREEIIQEESQQADLYKRATGTDFSQFDDWNLEERILRYVDSSLGEEKIEKYIDSRGKERIVKYVNPETNTTESGRAIAVIVPWRQRVEGFKRTKPDENVNGLWDRLYEITETIEGELYKKAMEVNPNLASLYPKHADFSQMVVDYIEYEIDQKDKPQEKKDFYAWCRENNRPLRHDTP